MLENGFRILTLGTNGSLDFEFFYWSGVINFVSCQKFFFTPKRNSVLFFFGGVRVRGVKLNSILP